MCFYFLLSAAELPVIENTKRYDVYSKYLPGCGLATAVQAMCEFCSSFWNQLKSLCPVFPLII